MMCVCCAWDDSVDFFAAFVLVGADGGCFETLGGADAQEHLCPVGGEPFAATCCADAYVCIRGVEDISSVPRAFHP